MSAIIFGIESYQLTNKEKKQLINQNAAGVILFSRNYKNKTQLHELCSEIKTIAPHLLLCVDHEGGRVQRFREGFTTLPPMKKIGDLYDKNHEAGIKMAENIGIIISYELSDFDLTLAPVLDLYNSISKVIGDRAFSASYITVGVLATAFRKGLQQGGMEAVGKHYAGHGNIEADSHHDVCYDNRPPEQQFFDKQVFFNQIQNGLRCVMTSHIIYPESDGLPCSFSPLMIQQLRNAFPSDCFIITDDLDMAGASTGETYPQRVQKALNAGVDCVLICNNFSAIDEVFQGKYDANHRRTQTAINHMKRTHQCDYNLYLSAKSKLETWLAN